MTHAETANIAYLEILAFRCEKYHFYSLILVFRSPTKNYDLFNMITIATTLQNLA